MLNRAKIKRRENCNESNSRIMNIAPNDRSGTPPSTPAPSTNLTTCGNDDIGDTAINPETSPREDNANENVDSNISLLRPEESAIDLEMGGNDNNGSSDEGAGEESMMPLESTSSDCNSLEGVYAKLVGSDEDDETIAAMIRERDEIDNELVEDAHKDMDGENEAKKIQAPESDAMREIWSSKTVTDPEGNVVYKATICRWINQKISLTKSTDRTKRVQRQGKYQGKIRDGTSAIERAFEFGAVGFDNDDADVLKYGDYGSIIVEAKMHEKNSASKYMVIVRLLAFGKVGDPQVERVWLAEDERCLVKVAVMFAEEHVNSAGEVVGFRLKDKLGPQIKNVHRSCIELLNPVTNFIVDSAATNESDVIVRGMSKCVHVFKMADLSNAHKNLSHVDRIVVLKNEVIKPMLMKGKPTFHYMIVKDDIVCRLCIPCTVITSDKDDKVRERCLRNHMAAHIIASRDGQWSGPKIPDDPCLYCCGTETECWINVRTSGKNPNQYIVEPHCVFYSVPPFKQLACLKTTKKYPSTNRPFLCLECNQYVPTYNMPAHLKRKHSFTQQEVEQEYNVTDFIISEEEKVAVMKLYPVVYFSANTKPLVEENND